MGTHAAESAKTGPGVPGELTWCTPLVRVDKPISSAAGAGIAFTVVEETSDKAINDAIKTGTTLALPDI